MNHPHDDSDPIEHDPTGMRALLGNLPDPAPMPDDLVARISAALADEVRLREGWAAPECPPELRAGDEPGEPEPEPHRPVRDATRDAAGGAASTGVVVPLHRRTGFRVLAAAAAVVGVLGVGGLVVETTSSGGIQAALGLAGSSDDSASGAGGSAAQADGNAVQRGPGVVADDPGTRVRVLADGDRLSAADLAAYAATLPTTSDDSGAEAAPQPAPDDTAAPVTAPERARDCATGLGVPSEDEVVVQLVVLDGSPAAVLVATSAAGSRTAWAVSRTCTADDPGVLSGPVPVS